MGKALKKLDFDAGQVIYAVPVDEDAEILNYFSNLEDAMADFDASWKIYELFVSAVIEVKKP